ncbi:hypothetical protein [Methylocella sp. CPCC 101449]|uniref:hypothetical protein n=1 Tax=Methylocella sp. CPCC 101449 TaxID=2987531 RepID=UPI00289251F3|nr:hypothetical protein [Methylocella sp. CPCC 101449]MDT2021262.1 hypothetical protein [Methylocella sp. CPCC 101449]
MRVGKTPINYGSTRNGGNRAPIHLVVPAMKDVPGDDPRMGAMGKSNTACVRPEFLMCAIPATTSNGWPAKAAVSTVRFGGDKEQALYELREAIESRDDSLAFCCSLVVDLVDWEFLANPRGRAAQ